MFVCLGNICRSPLAMNLFIHEVKKRGLENNFEIDSCGTSNYHIGSTPDERTIANARKNGLKIHHEARQFSKDDFDRFDYILVMDKSNHSDVMKLDIVGRYSDKVFLMRDFDPEEKGAEVPDPYFGGEQGFQNVYDILKRSVSELLDHITVEHNIR